MPNILEMFDFERDFLADVLRVLGERLSRLHSHVDWENSEESYLFDPMEHISGLGVVAAQRYLASTCKWFGVSRDDALRLGPQKKGVAVAAVVNAAANYWKHIEDGEGTIRASTRMVLEQIGVTLESFYYVSNALYECGCPQFNGLLEHLVSWRDAVSDYARTNQGEAANR